MHLIPHRNKTIAAYKLPLIPFTASLTEKCRTPFDLHSAIHLEVARQWEVTLHDGISVEVYFGISRVSQFRDSGLYRIMLKIKPVIHDLS